MESSITYALTFLDPNGKSITGTLTFGLSTENKSGIAVDILGKADVNGQTTVDYFLVQGTFSAPDLVGQQIYDLAGLQYVTQLGPPLTTILSATNMAPNQNLSLQFNFIDSPGQYIGGGLLWRPDGPESDEPWSLIGVQR